jgi:GNAT superfamily N-acetyltransferase
MMENSDWDDVEWRDLALGDIPSLATFAPAQWHLALDRVLLQHVARSYFHARVGLVAGRIVAVGQGIVTGSTGWVGNIIVRAEARNRGLGSRMTSELVGRLRAHGCATVILVATDMGGPVYRKLGFRTTSEYVFLDVPRLPVPSPGRVRRLEPRDVAEIVSLDAAATGESRMALLEPYLGAGWVHVDGRGVADGVFLPSFGAGFVVAGSAAAGLELLRFKHALHECAAVVPAANECALQFLREHGARETSRSPRMVLGGEAAWRPECIFARASGYCG